jgi:hypothetical protein
MGISPKLSIVLTILLGMTSQASADFIVEQERSTNGKDRTTVIQYLRKDKIRVDTVGPASMTSVFVTENKSISCMRASATKAKGKCVEVKHHGLGGMLAQMQKNGMVKIEDYKVTKLKKPDGTIAGRPCSYFSRIVRTSSKYSGMPAANSETNEEVCVDTAAAKEISPLYSELMSQFFGDDSDDPILKKIRAEEARMAGIPISSLSSTKIDLSMMADVARQFSSKKSVKNFNPDKPIKTILITNRISEQPIPDKMFEINSSLYERPRPAPIARPKPKSRPARRQADAH